MPPDPGAGGAHRRRPGRGLVPHALRSGRASTRAWGRAGLLQTRGDRRVGERPVHRGRQLLHDRPRDAGRAEQAALGESLVVHSSTNQRHAARIAGPLSPRRSAMVLRSAANRPVSHISLRLRRASRASRRLDRMRFRQL